MNDLYIALSVSMIVNFVMIAVNNYLIFAILTRFKKWLFTVYDRQVKSTK